MAGYGLRLARSQGQEGFSGNLSEFAISPANTAAIYTGDPVLLSSGYLIEATGASSNDDFAILGVFAGCRYIDTDGSVRYRQFWDGGAGRTNIRAHVILPTNGVFHIFGKSGTTYTQAAIGARYGVTYGAGSTAYGDSRTTLGAAAAASTGPLIIQGLADFPGNVIGGAQPVFEVTVVRPVLSAA